MVPVALKAAETLAEQGVSWRLSIRTIAFDIDTIVNSVKKTNRVVLAEESHPMCGFTVICTQIMSVRTI